MTSLPDILPRRVDGQLRVCLITSIFHGFGKIGGFGTMAKSLAMVLARNGYQVVVAVPRRPGQDRITRVAGFTVIGLTMKELVNPSVYAAIDADLYHSQSPNLMSTAAMRARPRARHVITCRDPRTLYDWAIEIRDATWRRKIRNVALMLFEEGPLVSQAIRRADRVAFAARFLEEKIVRMYRPPEPLHFLPNIEDVPADVPKKADRPTVCFVARFDRRKRPELYIRLAARFPEVSFTMIGCAEDAAWQEQLERMAAPLENLDMPGYVDKFDDPEFYSYYDRSWIFVNTASREAHPLTFFEAAGRGCAILSHVNPDDFASRFGYWAEHEDFEKGLEKLLSNDGWRSRGAAAHRYVRQYYRHEVSARAHLDLYTELLGQGTP